MHTYNRRIRITIIIFGLLILTLKPYYIKYDLIAYNRGKAVLVKDNVAITSAHLIDLKSKLLYVNYDLDIAIVEVSNKMSICSTRVKLQSNNKGFKVVNYTPYFGESGSMYNIGDKAIGIIVGRKDKKCVVSCIDRRFYKWILKEGYLD